MSSPKPCRTLSREGSVLLSFLHSNCVSPSVLQTRSRLLFQVISYNTALSITGCEKGEAVASAKQWQLAQTLFFEVLSQLKANLITFNAALGASGRLGALSGLVKRRTSAFLKWKSQCEVKRPRLGSRASAFFVTFPRGCSRRCQEDSFGPFVN